LTNIYRTHLVPTIC